MKRIVCSAACLLVACIAFDGRSTGYAQKPAHDGHHAHYDKCAKECNDCQRACDSCATHCAMLLAQGKKEHLHTLQTCQDCSSYCIAAATIVARRGPFSDIICKSCEEACARCAKACEKHPDDPHMKQCAEACRKCEKACREMVRHIADAPKVRTVK